MSIYGRNGYVEDEYNGGQGVPSVQFLVDSALANVKVVPGATVTFSPAAAGNAVNLPAALAGVTVAELRLNGAVQWQGKDYTIANGVVTFTGGGVTPADVIDMRIESIVTPGG